MVNDKAPGTSGLITNIPKNLPPKPKNQDIHYETWHMTTFSNIYKGKGDPHDPSNHQRFRLKERLYKVVSIIIA
jgi:hypothetical protein